MYRNIKAERHRPDRVLLTIYERETAISDKEAQELLMDLFNVLLGFAPAIVPARGE